MSSEFIYCEGVKMPDNLADTIPISHRHFVILKPGAGEANTFVSQVEIQNNSMT